MRWKELEIGDTISKTIEATTLWQTERGIIEISENTLSVPLKLDDQQKGCILHGQGKLLIDAIAETDEGAVGKSVEKELHKPFLMLGDTTEIDRHLTDASEEDFAKMGYENQQGFVGNAEDLRDQFFRGKVHSHKGFGEDHGLIFAFPNREGELDILIAKGSKLVYKATDVVFVLNKDKVVLKSQGGVICAGNGKSVIIKK
ncbi:MAG: hypothetical protein PVF15_04505 [Candidatus Bathyarchaeota archaeon]|jgi:hypothetical protein